MIFELNDGVIERDIETENPFYVCFWISCTTSQARMIKLELQKNKILQIVVRL